MENLVDALEATFLKWSSGILLKMFVLMISRWCLNPLGFSSLWFEPSSGHMWESQVLLTDGQVVFLQVLRFSPTFDERSARYKWNILERDVNPNQKKKKKKKKKIKVMYSFLSNQWLS